MENNKYWFFGSKLNTVLLLVLIILMIIALKFMWANKEYYKENIKIGASALTQSTEDFQFVQTKDFSFTTFKGLIASPTDFEGCPWFNVSVPNDGHMTKGEVGIYPMDCYDLTKTGGQKEYVEKSGYYIVHHFDNSMTEEEINFSSNVYQKIIDTFTSNKI